MTETPGPGFERFRMGYPLGAVVMAFYAGGAMPGVVQEGIPMWIRWKVTPTETDVRRGCIGKDAEILSTRDRKFLGILPPGGYR